MTPSPPENEATPPDEWRLEFTFEDALLGHLTVTCLPFLVGRNVPLFTRLRPDVRKLISREHAEVYLDEEGEVCLRDLNSVGKTYLNDEALSSGESVRLSSPCRLSFGRHLHCDCRFLKLASPVPAASETQAVPEEPAALPVVEEVPLMEPDSKENSLWDLPETEPATMPLTNIASDVRPIETPRPDSDPPASVAAATGPDPKQEETEPSEADNSELESEDVTQPGAALSVPPSDPTRLAGHDGMIHRHTPHEDVDPDDSALLEFTKFRDSAADSLPSCAPPTGPEPLPGSDSAAVESNQADASAVGEEGEPDSEQPAPQEADPPSSKSAGRSAFGPRALESLRSSREADEAGPDDLTKAPDDPFNPLQSLPADRPEAVTREPAVAPDPLAGSSDGDTAGLLQSTRLEPLNPQLDSIPISSFPYTIGRQQSPWAEYSRDPGLQSHLARLSRSHAVITCEDGRYFLEDLNSSRGTQLNDEPLKAKARLENLDFIVFGSKKLSYRFLDDTDGGNALDSGIIESKSSIEIALPPPTGLGEGSDSSSGGISRTRKVNFDLSADMDLMRTQDQAYLGGRVTTKSKFRYLVLVVFFVLIACASLVFALLHFLA